MKPKAIYYFFIVLLVTTMMACGADDDDSETTETETPTTTSSPTEEPTVTVERNVDFAAEEEAIRELYAVYATAHGEQDTDTLGEVWLRKSEDKEIFTAWTFWAGAFERNIGWKDVNDAWEGIFRLRQGKVTVDITYIAIDAKGKEAVLRGAYKWGNLQGDLISALQKDKDSWKIRAIDYTGGKHGKQVKDLNKPAYTFGEIDAE